ncbi:isoprenyl transferase [Kurthia huakuii]|uniref:isoprenyl transferase n=1 Tax=Kurthia huakuii TaxID=1421019 RepID=UPI0004968591|nr:isoprenyl transferase [Kurthia huakuii]MBM7698298.1 undecaprenyl diphosphate synthase [Kurthia huakuii]
MLDKLGWRKTDKKNATLEQRMIQVRSESVPQHIAIIMDGNGRWAQKRALPRVAGHHEGMKNIRTITRCANKVGIRALTLYAFSTENWKRPRKEVEFLMRLPEEFLTSFLPELMELNIRVMMIGEISDLPMHTQNAVRNAMDTTANNTGMILNFALNYGSRREMVLSVQEIVNQVQNGTLSLEDISEETISNHLMTSNLPDPDLLIRTSGELRLSNFLLWQLAYSEFWFTDVHWPEFSEKDLLEAVESYQSRNRRYGGLKGE